VVSADGTQAVLAVRDDALNLDKGFTGGYNAWIIAGS